MPDASDSVAAKSTKAAKKKRIFMYFLLLC
jgi:hypothetical protein